MENSESVEHIFLGTDDAPGAAQRVRNSELEQRSRLHGLKVDVTIFNDHFLSVEASGTRSTPQDFWINLAFLDSNAQRDRYVAWHWLATALALLVITGLALRLALRSSLPVDPSAQVAMICLLVAATAGATAALVFRSRDLLVFHTRHGRVPLLRLLNRNPDRERFEIFIEKLGEQIEATRDARFGSELTQLLSAELREHRRLLEEGVLSREQYDAAKRRILRCH